MTDQNNNSRLPDSLKGMSDILNERKRQNNRWGEQNHNDFIWSAILGEEVGEACQSALHDEFGGKASGTLRAELIHVAAVALQWIECIDRREGYVLCKSCGAYGGHNSTCAKEYPILNSSKSEATK